MTRAEILAEAEKCVCGKREQDYGTPENNFGTIADFWTTYLRAAHPYEPGAQLAPSITDIDIGMMMALLKIARIATGSTPDSFIDLAGYAACAGEIATRTTGFARSENTCVVCGASIPEGSQFCKDCFHTPSLRGVDE